MGGNAGETSCPWESPGVGFLVGTGEFFGRSAISDVIESASESLLLSTSLESSSFGGTRASWGVTVGRSVGFAVVGRSVGFAVVGRTVAGQGGNLQWFSGSPFTNVPSGHSFLADLH